MKKISLGSMFVIVVSAILIFTLVWSFGFVSGFQVKIKGQDVLRIHKYDERYTIFAGDQVWHNLTDTQCDSVLVYELQIGANQ